MKLAQLFGPQGGGLSGVGNDVAMMSTLLESRGFEIRRREGPEANRAGILEGYEKLISDTNPDDVVVVYYSGHGGTEPPDDATGNIDRDHQFLVPTDFPESTASHFLGITRVELSVLSARLSARTPNSTVILDCCHSGHMSRDPKLRAKSLVHPNHQDITAHIERLIADGLRVDLLDPVGNKQAVRVVACGPLSFSYEYTNRDGLSIGLLTESLRMALDEADGQAVTWAAVVERVRARIGLIAPTQRPEVEGVPQRLVFETETVEPVDTILVARAGPDRVSLPGARLVGLEIGDTLTVEPPSRAPVPDEAVVAIATVDRISSTGVGASLAFRGGHTTVPLGARARLASTTARRQTVVVAGDGPVADHMRSALAKEPMLRAVTDDDPDADIAAARLDVGTELTLRDAVGPLVRPVPPDSAGIARMVANATLLARSAMMRAVTPGANEALPEPFTVEWGLVAGGRAQPMPMSGAVVYEGDLIYVRLRNDSGRDLFFHVIDRGVDGAIGMVTDLAFSGIQVEPGREYVVGQLDQGELVGVPAGWPDGVPPGFPRPESVLVLVISGAQDLSAITQVGVRDPWVAKGAVKAVEELRATGSSLQRALAQAAIGGSRNLGREPRGAAIRYTTRSIDFLLSPLPRPVDETTRFLVDERPPPSMRLMGPPERGTNSTAMCVNELTMPGDWQPEGSTLRVDSLVITAGNDGTPVYHATTLRSPVAGSAIYNGPVLSYVDFACWVSIDRPDIADLAVLLADQVDLDEFRHEAARLASLALAQPESALAVAGLGSTAVLVDTASRLLTTVDPVSLYRTCLLPGENFGAGAHSVTGSLGTRDFSFTYQVRHDT